MLERKPAQLTCHLKELFIASLTLRKSVQGQHMPGRRSVFFPDQVDEIVLIDFSVRVTLNDLVQLIDVV